MKQELDKLFYPKTIAIIGASNNVGSVGYTLMKNVMESSFGGSIFPVNLKHSKVQGKQCYYRVADIIDTIDLAVIATPARTVSDLIKECGEQNIKTALIISSGFKKAGGRGRKMEKEILQIAQKYGVRIIGPNSLGIINSNYGLNATFANRTALPGKIAFISQSGALSTSILDWSVQQNVGFSKFVSIGSTVDVGFHDLIDYFGADVNISCILIYMESLENARAFMSAARAFSISKPIIVLKAGRSKTNAYKMLTHTRTFIGDDIAFDAAFKRAGVIRVDTVAQLFHSAQALAMQVRPKGNRLAIVTNSGGPAILAIDYLLKHGGTLAKLPKKSQSFVDKIIAISWRYYGPLDESNNLSTAQYRDNVETLLEDDKVDGVLAILTPERQGDALTVAKEIIPISKKYKKTFLTCWMGEEDVKEARELFEQENIPSYRYPESAVEVFLKMYSYTKNIELLYETPPAIPHQFTPNQAKAKSLINDLINEDRFRLSELESKKLLSYYDIKVSKSSLASNATEAVQLAVATGFPVALKIASPDIVHKTEVNGVHLNVKTRQEVETLFATIISNAKAGHTEANLLGVLVEPMYYKKYELLIGAKKDPIFGPVILFGMGGVAVEVFKDVNVGLPPLNMALAQRIIEGTKVYELLKGYRGLAGVDLEALQFMLCKFAYLLMDFPEIETIDLNPYMIDKEGGVVLDATIYLDKNIPIDQKRSYEHLIISPYPIQYTKRVKMKNGRYAKLRPIRPEDEALEKELFDYLSKETIYFRFFGYIPKINHKLLSRFTHIDYDREMAIVAEITEEGKKRLAGVVRLIADPWNISAEYAIVIADHCQGMGLGKKMTDYIMEIARDKGIKKITATVLAANERMIHILKKRNFKLRKESYDIFVAELGL